jgi:hypothetical protein
MRRRRTDMRVNADACTDAGRVRLLANAVGEGLVVAVSVVTATRTQEWQCSLGARSVQRLEVEIDALERAAVVAALVRRNIIIRLVDAITVHAIIIVSIVGGLSMKHQRVVVVVAGARREVAFAHNVRRELRVRYAHDGGQAAVCRRAGGPVFSSLLSAHSFTGERIVLSPFLYAA